MVIGEHGQLQPAGHARLVEDVRKVVLLTWGQTRTGNVLVRRGLFVDRGNWFDPKFLSGSDNEFFRRMMQLSYRFVWCDEAVVYEVVPSARWKRSFLIRRDVFRSVFSFRKSPCFGAVMWSLVAASAYVVVLPAALLMGQAKLMRYVFRLSYHLGRLVAVLGINPIKQPYVTD